MITCIVVSHISCLLSIDCRTEIENLKAEIQGIKSDIANIKQPIATSSISSDMDDLKSLFSLDGGCSPFVPLATGTTSHYNLLSPPPPPPTIRPRVNSLPSTIPTAGPSPPLGPLIISHITLLSLPRCYRLQVYHILSRPLIWSLQVCLSQTVWLDQPLSL